MTREPMQARQLEDHLLRQRIAEQAELGILRQREQRQDGDPWRRRDLGGSLGGGRAGKLRPNGGGGRRRRGRGQALDRGGELEAAGPDRAQMALLRAVIAECLADRLDAARHGRVRDDPALPHLLDDRFARDHLAGVLDEEAQQIENERLDVDLAVAGPQDEPLRIELETVEAVPHGAAPANRIGAVAPTRRHAPHWPDGDNDRRTWRRAHSPANLQTISMQSPSFI